TGLLADQAAEQVGQGEEGPAQQRGGQHEAAEGPDQQVQLDILDQGADGDCRAAETDEYRQRQDQAVTDELAEQYLPAADGVGHQQHQGAAFVLTDDGIVDQQPGDQRRQDDGKAGQTGDGGRNRNHVQQPGRRRPVPGDDHHQYRNHHTDGQQPAVAQVVAEFLARNVPYLVHALSSA